MRSTRLLSVTFLSNGRLIFFLLFARTDDIDPGIVIVYELVEVIHECVRPPFSKYANAHLNDVNKKNCNFSHLSAKFQK